MASFWVNSRQYSNQSRVSHPDSPSLEQTTCGADGKIVAWDLSQSEPRVEKVIEGFLPVIKDYTCVPPFRILWNLSNVLNRSDEYSYDCSAVWHSSGQYFIVATPAHGKSYPPHFPSHELKKETTQKLLQFLEVHGQKCSHIQTTNAPGQ